MMLASHSAEFNTLIEGLADADETTRRHSAEDLADFRDPAASKWLAATLGDPSAAVRETVVDALVTIGGEETAAEIIPFMASDDPACRNAACESLRRIGPKAAGPLGRAIEGGDRDVRIFSLDILSEIGGTAAIAGIARVLENPDPNLAAAAALALGKIGSEEAVASLTARPSPEPWVRCAIAESLGRIGGDRANKGLLVLLADPDDTVCYSAVRALGECGDQSAILPLAEMLDKRDLILVATATESLERVASRLTLEEIALLEQLPEFNATAASKFFDLRTILRQRRSAAPRGPHPGKPSSDQNGVNE